MKTEVYSWRLSMTLKRKLSAQAKLKNTTIGALLDEAATEWIARQSEAKRQEQEERKRIMKAAEAFFGTIEDTESATAENVRKRMGEGLAKKYGRRRAA